MMIQPVSNRNNSYKPGFGKLTDVGYSRVLEAAGYSAPELIRQAEKIKELANQIKGDVDYTTFAVWHNAGFGKPEASQYVRNMPYSKRAEYLSNFEGFVKMSCFAELAKKLKNQ